MDTIASKADEILKLHHSIRIAYEYDLEVKVAAPKNDPIEQTERLNRNLSQLLAQRKKVAEQYFNFPLPTSEQEYEKTEPEKRYILEIFGILNENIKKIMGI